MDLATDSSCSFRLQVSSSTFNSTFIINSMCDHVHLHLHTLEQVKSTTSDCDCTIFSMWNNDTVVSNATHNYIQLQAEILKTTLYDV